MNRLSNKKLVLVGGAVAGVLVCVLAAVLLLGPFDVRYGIAVIAVLGAGVAVYAVRALRRIARRAAATARSVAAVQKLVTDQQAHVEGTVGALNNLVSQDRFELISVLEAQAKALEAVTTQLAVIEEKAARDAQRLSKSLAKLQERASGGTVEDFARLEALLDLRNLLEPRAAMPRLRGSADATTLLRVVQAVLDRKPPVVVACGSGVSSLWIGYALEKLGTGRCITLEQDADSARFMRQEIERHGLSSVVDVREAPLRPLEISGERFWWYDLVAIDDIRDAGVVFVDGPTESKSRGSARFPTVPVLRRVLDEHGALVIIADADRPDAKFSRQRWCDEFDATVVRESTVKAAWTSLSVPAR